VGGREVAGTAGLFRFDGKDLRGAARLAPDPCAMTCPSQRSRIMIALSDTNLRMGVISKDFASQQRIFRANRGFFEQTERTRFRQSLLDARQPNFLQQYLSLSNITEICRI